MCIRRLNILRTAVVAALVTAAPACEPAPPPSQATVEAVAQPPRRTPGRIPSLRATAPVGPDTLDVPIVFLVHGLGRRAASLAPMGRGLVAAGFEVVNFGYPSWTGEADSLVAMLSDTIAACCADRLDEVNFVTHSLGGILVRKYLQDQGSEHSGRVVMLAPPNGGSEIIDFVQTVPGLRALLGPTGSALGTDSTSLPNTLGPAQFELGVITGDRSLNPIYSWLIPGPDDGKVSVESAIVPGLDQFLVVPFSHSFVMNREEVLDEIMTFLATGSFSQAALEAWAYSPDDSTAIDPDSVDVLPDSQAIDRDPADTAAASSVASHG